jgi:tetratricopeptide (TPR) repeat protein
VISSAGRDSPFTLRVSKSEVARWETQLGPAWIALHHYCAGIVFAERARRASNRGERRNDIDRALYEYRYSLARTPADNPMYAVIATDIGSAHQLDGNKAEAEAAFDMAIKTHPELGVGYQGKAMLYREQKRLDEALRILDEGNKATEGKSSEINYFMGLILFDVGSYEQARDHARQAYDLGYPLPGLANKLARAGFPLN